MGTDVDDLDLEDFDDLDEEEEERQVAKKSKGKGSSKPKGIGASVVAEKLGADAKTFRAWLRRKIAAGDIDVDGHEFKARYTWDNWKDPELVAIMKAWKDDPHERGGGVGRPKGSGKKEKPAESQLKKKKATSKKVAKKKKAAKK